jgi:hypothetical protein
MKPDEPGTGHEPGLCGSRLKQPRPDGRSTCALAAGYKTPHPGIGRCHLHGGTTPTHIAAAQRQQAVTLLGTLGVVDDPASLPTPAVHAELELSAAKQLAAVRWLEQQVGALRPEQVEISPWPAMLREHRRDSDRLMLELVRLGLDARRVQLEERHLDLLQAAMDQFARALGHDPETAPVRAAARQSLLALDGGAL